MNNKLYNILVEDSSVIAVGLKINGKVSWFVSDLELWIMDYGAYSRAFDPSDNDFSGRFDIEILDKTTVIDFMIKMGKYSYSTSELREYFLPYMTIAKNLEDMMILLPSLFIDMDSSRLSSLYFETTTFETCIPPNWEGYYEDFLDEVPYAYRYWIDGEVDYGSKFEKGVPPQK